MRRLFHSCIYVYKCDVVGGVLLLHYKYVTEHINNGGIHANSTTFSLNAASKLLLRSNDDVQYSAVMHACVITFAHALTCRVQSLIEATI